jgi:hypothetical protein
MNRIFKQKGQGYGAGPMSVIAKINGSVVYSGEVPVVDLPIPAMPDPEVDYGIEMFSWELDSMFSGNIALEINVSGEGTLLLTETVAQLQPVMDPTKFAGPIYAEEINKFNYTDPFVDVAINGVGYPTEHDPELPGQRYWLVPSSGKFTASVQINQFKPMQVAPAVDTVLKEFTVGVEATPTPSARLEVTSATSTGVGPYTITVTPALPEGLYISDDTFIRGTPTSVSPATMYSFTAVDQLGSTGTVSYKMVVNPA